MVLLKLLLFTLTFYVLIVHLDAKTCPKGQKVTRNNGCADCSNGTFQPTENQSQQCKACTWCDDKSGSELVEHCTKEKNTKCKCRGEFRPSDDDYSTCKCDIGFGLYPNGVCLQCEDGYFNDRINSPCRKWKDCKSAGEKSKGSRTSDVICNEEPKSNTSVTTPPTSNIVVSLITHLTSHRPQEGTQTQKMHATTTTTSAPGHTVPSKEPPFSPSNTGILLIFGIVGLLLLTAVTCKLLVTPCIGRQPPVRKNESLCRRPVEESGNGSLSSLKLNPWEP